VTLVYALDHRHPLAGEELSRLIGGKAAGLAVMAELGLPVPPGFVITTEACRAFLSTGWPAGLDDELKLSMSHLEGAAGRKFGDPTNPLLVSVRSGAPVSMPGMMDTILNLGLNAATTRGLAAVSGDPNFARECHERLVAMFTRVTRAGSVPEDPWRQLRAAVEAVFRSWNSDRASAYREREGIPDNLGTAVTVQAMVFGNRGRDSATGVVFTRNPATGEPALFGDILFAGQGEDVVAGTHDTEPVSALDVRMPKVGAQLREYCSVLEHHFADLCDVEFTIEQGKLWLLQSRIGKRSRRAALRIAVDMASEPGFPLSRSAAVERVASLLIDPPVVSALRRGVGAPLAVGLAASPGVASGEIATSSAAAVAAAESGRGVILVRSETSPDDVRGMARAAGVLTSRGGIASHAAVVARGWGIPAVVGAGSVAVGDQAIAIGGRRLGAGEMITIDGDTGEVFAGSVAASATVAPEAGTLLAWARELGIDIGAPSPPAASESPGEDMLRALLVKGSMAADGSLDTLRAAGLAEVADGEYRLTTAGKTAARDALAADQERWGVERAGAALDSFHALDVRVKEVVTAWQLRGSVLNDHSDRAYDEGVLERLAGAHRDAAAWFDDLDGPPPGLARYRVRLGLALENARGGNHLFVASPRVDSYHGVWFELHEALILLAGRNREDEAAAGRA